MRLKCTRTGESMLENNLITLQELRDCQSFIEKHKVELLCIKDYSIVNVCCEILDRESKSILFTLMNCDCVYITGSSYSFWKDKLSKLTENIEVIRENINQRNSDSYVVKTSVSLSEYKDSKTQIFKFSNGELLDNPDEHNLFDEFEYLITRLCDILE